MVRLRTVEDAAYQPLLKLPYADYLCAMWVICGELRAIYRSSTSEPDASIMTEALGVVRRAIESPSNYVDPLQVGPLQERMSELITAQRDIAEVGLMNAWFTFEALVDEIVGMQPKYSAAQWFLGAVVEHYRDPDDALFRRVDQDEEIEEASHTVQMLQRFGSVVRLIDERIGADTPRDPGEIRAAVFGQ